MFRYWKKPVIYNRYEYLVQCCFDKKVLDVGCIGNLDVSDYNNWYHNSIKKISKNLVGIDINESKVNALNELGFNILNIDLSSEDFNVDSIGKFDIIIMGEIIEHISNLYQFFENIKCLLMDEGEIIITTPNASSFAFFGSSLLRKKRVLSDQHMMIHSIETLHTLLSSYQFKVIDWKYYSCSNRYRILKEIVFNIYPHLAAGIIVHCKKL